MLHLLSVCVWDCSAKVTLQVEIVSITHISHLRRHPGWSEQTKVNSIIPEEFSLYLNFYEIFLIIIDFIILPSISVAKLAIHMLHNHISLLKATCLWSDVAFDFFELYDIDCFQKCRTRAQKLGILIVDDPKDRREMSNESLHQSFANIPVSGCCHAYSFK